MVTPRTFLELIRASVTTTLIYSHQALVTPEFRDRFHSESNSRPHVLTGSLEAILECDWIIDVSNS